MLNVMKFKDESTHEIACDAACSVQPVADIRPAECMSGSIRGGGAHKRNTDYEPALDCWTHTITHTHTHTHTLAQAFSPTGRRVWQGSKAAVRHAPVHTSSMLCS